jgi:mono/diheme cytochrome c family protein
MEGMTMTRRLGLIVFVALTIAAGMTAATQAKPVTYTLPAEASTLKQAPDPGYGKAEALCVSCHSRDYITTQPPGKGKEFWAAEVTKMVVVYGAPIPEADRVTIAAYLAATY